MNALGFVVMVTVASTVAAVLARRALIAEGRRPGSLISMAMREVGWAMADMSEAAKVAGAQLRKLGTSMTAMCDSTYEARHRVRDE